MIKYTTYQRMDEGVDEYVDYIVNKKGGWEMFSINLYKGMFWRCCHGDRTLCNIQRRVGRDITISQLDKVGSLSENTTYMKSFSMLIVSIMDTTVV